MFPLYSQSFPPLDAAVATWMNHHGATSMSGLQLLKGAVTGPNLKCSGSISGGSEGDPAVADVNGDGLNEIVILTYSPVSLYAFRGTDCTLLWQTSLASSYGWGTPSVGELNPSVPGLEIVVGYAGGTLWALRGTNGSIMWSVSVGVSYSPATIFDVNGDGYGEVFVVGTSNIYALRGTDGSVIWTYPAGSNFANAAIYDINNDSQYELITVAGGSILVLRATNGTLLWSYSIGTQGNPVIADLDNDGFAEIVVAAGNGNVYALRNNGTLYWSWMSGCGSYWSSLNSPTAADVNGDGMVEILFGCMPSSTGYLYVLRGTNGSVLWSYTGTRSGYQALGRKVGDIDNDGELEIIVSGARYGGSPHLVVLRGADGTVKWTYDADYFEGLAIADADNDGCMEIISNCDFASTRFYIFDSPVPVSDCGVLGYDDPVGAAEKREVSGLYLKVEQFNGGIRIITGRDAYVDIYSTSGRKISSVKTHKGEYTLRLPKGSYVLKVRGFPLYRSIIVR